MSSKLAMDLYEVVRDWLLANRPAGVPASVAYRAAQDTAPVERPYFAALCENVVERGKITRGELVLRMRTLADDTTATDAAAWHQASARALRGNFDALKSALQAKGYWLRTLRARDYEDLPDGKLGRRYERRWAFSIQTEM